MKMRISGPRTRRAAWACRLAAAWWIATTAWAEPAPDLSSLLEQAIYAEETAGDLDGAIAVYQRILQEAAASRQISAQAQFKLGLCYEKKGAQEQASAAFEKVLVNYPEEAALNDQARQRLTRLKTAPPSLPAGFGSGGVPVFNGTYRHLWGNQDVRYECRRNADGNLRYSLEDLGGATYTLVTDAQGLPLEYTSKYSGGEGQQFRFLRHQVIWIQGPDPIRTNTITPGARPDFNSRPDPYLSEYVLLKAYDFAQGGPQDLIVYDVNNRGDALNEYVISLDLADQDGVDLPNGRFKARHLVQMQKSDSHTWFKKHKGSRTDIWVNEAGQILRILRAREPYEVVLVDYDNPADYLGPVSAPAAATVVTSTAPVTLTTDVDPALKEITASFNQPMRDRQWSWCGPPETFPAMAGSSAYDADRVTCRLPVKLEPGKVYWVGINSPSHKNFKSLAGSAAREYVILFATADEQGQPTPIPEGMLKEAAQINAAGVPDGPSGK